MLAVVEAAACQHNGEAAVRERGDPMLQSLFCIDFAGILPEVLFELPGAFEFSAVEEFCVAAGADAPEGGCLFFKNFTAGQKDIIFHISHAAQLFVCQTKKFLQAQFLINGVGPIQGTAIRTLNAANTGLQILLKRMPLQMAEIVQTDIGADLEFQCYIIVSHILQQLFPFCAAKVTGIETVANPQRRHGLPFLQRIDNATDTVGNIIAQAVIFAGMNLKHKTGIFAGNGNKFPDNTVKFENIIDFFADNITPSDVGISGNNTKAAQIFCQIIIRCNPVPHNRERDTADTCEKAYENTGFASNGRHDLMNLSELQRKLRFVQKRSISDFYVFNTLLFIFPRDPE